MQQHGRLQTGLVSLLKDNKRGRVLLQSVNSILDAHVMAVSGGSVWKDIWEVQVRFTAVCRHETWWTLSPKMKMGMVSYILSIYPQVFFIFQSFQSINSYPTAAQGVRDLLPLIKDFDIRGKMLVTLILLRPHDVTDIYPEIIRLIDYRFLAVPAFRSRLAIHHINVMARLTKLDQCDFATAVHILRHLLTLNSRDAVTAALVIVQARPTIAANSAPNGCMRLTADHLAEIADDPEPFKSDALPTGDEDDHFITADLIDLLVAAAHYYPESILKVLSAFAGKNRDAPPLLPEDDTAAIATAIANALIALDYTVIDTARTATDGLLFLYGQRDTPPAILRRLQSDHLGAPNFTMAFEACMHNFLDHPSFAGSDIFVRCPLVYRIIYGHGPYYFEDPLALAAVLNHAYPFTAGDPFTFPSHRRLAKKIDWTHITGSKSLFRQLMFSAPNMWARLGEWALRTNTTFTNFGVHRRVIRCLWGFAMAHEFTVTPAGLCVEGTIVCEQIRAQTAATHSFEAWESMGRIVGNIHISFTKMQLDLIHEDAPLIVDTASISRFSRAGVDFLGVVDRTYRWVYTALCNFKGVVLVGFPIDLPSLTLPIGSTKDTCLLDADDDVINYAELADFMKDVLNVSLWTLLHPTDPLVIPSQNTTQFYAWLGFFIHPLFQKLLGVAPFVHPQFINHIDTFVTKDGEPAQGLTHFIPHPGRPIFWPGGIETLLPTGLQIFHNYRLGVNTTPIYFTEWLQTRLITTILRIRKESEFDAMRVNKINLITAEHPILNSTDIDAMDCTEPILVNKNRAPPRVDAIHLKVRKPPPPARKAVGMHVQFFLIPNHSPNSHMAAGSLNLTNLEPELLYRIYTHLVVLQLQSRPPHLPPIQKSISQDWFFTPFTPVYQPFETNLFVCPLLIHSLTDNRGLLLDNPTVLLRAAVNKLLESPDLAGTIAETDNPNFTIRVLRHDHGFQYILEPHAQIHFIHANFRPRLVRRLD